MNAWIWYMPWDISGKHVLMWVFSDDGSQAIYILGDGTVGVDEQAGDLIDMLRTSPLVWRQVYP
jgi:hypothetical protein